MSDLVSLSREELSLIAGGNERAVRFFEQIADLVSRTDPFYRSVSIVGDLQESMGGIPTWATEITVAMSSAGLPDNGDLMVQIGGLDNTGAGFYYTSGYFSTASRINGAVVDTNERNDGFHIRLGDSTESVMGCMVLTKLRGNSGDRWVASHAVRSGDTRVSVGGGRILATEEVSQVRLVSTTGSVFNNGFIGFTFRR
jgi:hypothetical protein